MHPKGLVYEVPVLNLEKKHNITEVNNQTQENWKAINIEGISEIKLGRDSF